MKDGLYAKLDTSRGNILIELSGSEISSFDVQESNWSTEVTVPASLAAGNYTIKFESSDDAASIDYTMSTGSDSLNLATGLAQIELVVSSQMPNITISFTVTDFTGNTASFDTLFCTSCLVQENVQDDVEDEEQEVTKDSDKKNKSIKMSDTPPTSEELEKMGLFVDSNPPRHTVKHVKLGNYNKRKEL